MAGINSFFWIIVKVNKILTTSSVCRFRKYISTLLLLILIQLALSVLLWSFFINSSCSNIKFCFFPLLSLSFEFHSYRIQGFSLPSFVQSPQIKSEFNFCIFVSPLERNATAIDIISKSNNSRHPNFELSIFHASNFMKCLILKSNLISYPCRIIIVFICK